MAKKTQAAKRHRQSLIKQARNYAYRSKLRTFVKGAKEAIAGDTEDKDESVRIACRELDRMVTKGVIHKNNASRKKSRLMAAYVKTRPSAVQPSEPAPTPETPENDTDSAV